MSSKTNEFSELPRNFTVTTDERVRALLGGLPAFVRRRRRIEDLEAAIVHRLRVHAAKRGRSVNSAAPPAALVRALASLRELVEDHNRYYPIEANLPIDRAAGGLLDGGKLWVPLALPTLEALLARAVEKAHADRAVSCGRTLAMIDHTGLDVSDPVRSRRFYETALAPLGYKVLMEVPTEFTGGAVVLGMGVPPKPDFWLHQGTPQKPPLHIAFRADNRALVDAFYKAALAAGGKDNGPPGVRPHYHKDYYGAFVLDPDGHNIEACCHTPG